MDLCGTASRISRKVLAPCAVVGVLLGAAAVAVVLREPVVDPQVPPHLAIWSHQGYAARYPANSLDAVAAAIDAGAGGVELDVHFDAPHRRFVVSRTRDPFQTPGGRLLTLEEVLSRHGPATGYWIDLKNLTLSNAGEVASLMSVLLGRFDATAGTFVESTRGWALRALRRAGLKTIYTIDLKPGDWSHVPRIVAATAMVALNDHTAIGVPHESMSTAFMYLFGHHPLFVFTVNDPVVLARLERLSSVRVVLSDDLFARASRSTTGPDRGG